MSPHARICSLPPEGVRTSLRRLGGGTNGSW
jgi:hypothetical protein